MAAYISDKDGHKHPRDNSRLKPQLHPYRYMPTNLQLVFIIIIWPASSRFVCLVLKLSVTYSILWIVSSPILSFGLAPKAKFSPSHNAQNLNQPGGDPIENTSSWQLPWTRVVSCAWMFHLPSDKSTIRSHNGCASRWMKFEILWDLCGW